MLPQPTIELRPLRIPQLLDQAIFSYRRHFLTFLGIVAVMQLPLAALQLASAALMDPSVWQYLGKNLSAIAGLAAVTGLMGNMLAILLSGLLVQGIAGAAISRAMLAARMGQPVGFVSAYRAILPFWKRLLGIHFMNAVILVGITIWSLVPCIGWLSGPGMLSFVGLGFTPLLSVVVVVEGRPVMDSLRRVWDLVRRRFWWVIGFGLLIELFAQVIVTGPTLLLGSLMVWFVTSSPELLASSTNMLSSIVQVFAGNVIGSLFAPITLCAYALFYLDLRVRTEGLDLALQMDDSAQTNNNDPFTAPAAPASAAASADGLEAHLLSPALATLAPPPELTPLITNNELIRFSSITGAVVVLYIAIVIAVMGLFILLASLASL